MAQVSPSSVVYMEPHLKILLGCQCHRTSEATVILSNILEPHFAGKGASRVRTLREEGYEEGIPAIEGPRILRAILGCSSYFQSRMSPNPLPSPEGRQCGSLLKGGKQW